ncbi:hypothetical protein [Pseudomonas sp. PDM04]|uniref:hypothetical protein n=1 Tax=Pseudomonas sp. PDM04 TaxID=2769296 RepID=UPI001781FDE6|nr:hypothetical protein [Pseudomonas sp. PDM04]MBD9442296.1 hypothetical protein [Pseudomonas sp. PDM04]
MIVLFEVGNPCRLSGVPEGVYQVFGKPALDSGCRQRSHFSSVAVSAIDPLD